MEALSITPNLELPAADLERFYGDMVRIRRFEERVTELFKAGAVKGTAHSYVGEEAIAVGACAASAPGRLHREPPSRPRPLHRQGRAPRPMMAELMGRVTGYCGGLGGSMHVADLARNILGANGIVGAGMPLSVRRRARDPAARRRPGGRRVLRRRRQQPGHLSRMPQSRRGLEAAGAVRVREQPVRAVAPPCRHTTSIDRWPERAPAYGIPGCTVDGNDILAVHAAVGEAVARARAGDGPSLIEAMT